MCSPTGIVQAQEIIAALDATKPPAKPRYSRSGVPLVKRNGEYGA